MRLPLEARIGRVAAIATHLVAIAALCAGTWQAYGAWREFTREEQRAELDEKAWKAAAEASHQQTTYNTTIHIPVMIESISALRASDCVEDREDCLRRAHEQRQRDEITEDEKAERDRRCWEIYEGCREEVAQWAKAIQEVGK